MNVLLTGGTGFFGRALLRHWLEVVHRCEFVFSVTVLSRSPENFLALYPEFAGHSWLRLHRGDILDPSSLPSEGGFTHVLHAAADSTAGPQLSPLQRYTQIVDGTRHLLEYAAAHRIPRFLLTSSGGVYGPQPPHIIGMTECFNAIPEPMDATHAYSIAKRCAEHLCVLYQQQYGIQVVVARCFAFVGPDLPLDAHFAIGNFIRDALCGSSIFVNGDGTPVRTYMDQRDLARWLEVLLCKGEAGRAYNVGSDAPITIAQLAHLVRDTLAPHKAVNIAGGVIMAGSFRNRYVPSIDRARIELGLELKYMLTQSIQYTADNSRAIG